jgi:hypothetical protein
MKAKVYNDGTGDCLREFQPKRAPRMTASELKHRVQGARHDSKFFCRENMNFAGDTMRNYGVRGPFKFKTHSGDTCEVWELFRRRAVKYGLRASAYFRADTYAQTFGELLTTVAGYDGVPYGIGDRVEIHPGSALWMRGARFGVVESFSLTPNDRVKVRLDKLRGMLHAGSADTFRKVTP